MIYETHKSEIVYYAKLNELYCEEMVDIRFLMIVRNCYWSMSVDGVHGYIIYSEGNWWVCSPLLVLVASIDLISKAINWTTFRFGKA